MNKIQPAIVIAALLSTSTVFAVEESKSLGQINDYFH
jgi:hypothetical protein